MPSTARSPASGRRSTVDVAAVASGTIAWCSSSRPTRISAAATSKSGPTSKTNEAFARSRAGTSGRVLARAGSTVTAPAARTTGPSIVASSSPGLPITASTTTGPPFASSVAVAAPKVRTKPPYQTDRSRR